MTLRGFGMDGLWIPRGCDATHVWDEDDGGMEIRHLPVPRDKYGSRSHDDPCLGHPMDA